MATRLTIIVENGASRLELDEPNLSLEGLEAVQMLLSRSLAEQRFPYADEDVELDEPFKVVVLVRNGRAFFDQESLSTGIIFGETIEVAAAFITRLVNLNVAKMAFVQAQQEAMAQIQRRQSGLEVVNNLDRRAFGGLAIAGR